MREMSERLKVRSHGVRVSHLAEFREVVLLTEGALPQPCSVVPNGLVITLPLGAPVSNACHHTGDKFT